MSETTRAQNTQYPTVNSKTTPDARTISDAFLSALKNPAIKSSGLPSGSDLPSEPYPSHPTPANNAVAQCIEAYADAMEDAVERRLDRYDSAKQASRAFRQAMPPLSGHDNIRDFIACVAQAILMEAIPGDEAARLLYAAQIAYAARETRNSRSRPS
jgi:hypothetical protein